ncbi:MAG: hypothetical protein C4334_00295 [Pyrinomonas sp.]|uniref:diguanylate cyclase n=1 Tax=Pyrinomonas sp. TaxID=2080306 RepID=UPI003322455C
MKSARQIIHQRSWVAFLVLISAAAILCLVSAAHEVSRQATTERLRWLGALLVLTIFAAHFAITADLGIEDDREAIGHRSLADIFILLGAMVQGAATATVLAAVAGPLAARHRRRARFLLLASANVVATYVAASAFELLVSVIDNPAAVAGGASLGVLLLPLTAMAFVQHGLIGAADLAFARLQTSSKLQWSREALLWATLTQMASAAVAALFYTAWYDRDPSFLFVGALVVAFVYLLNRLNVRHITQIRRAEAERRKHLEEIARLHMNMVESLAIAIDAKDQTTHGHVRRTQIYAMELGRVLGVSEAELRALEAGALLHDIGKLAVPEYILNKPGKLTAAEFEKMKIHTVVGADIVRRVGFPYPVEEIVRYHHEKWDGTGYPRGLRGEEIPLVARIIAVVDFYDATRCDRPYRRGMTREESLALLRRLSGSSFDPRIVETFIANVERFDQLIAEQDIEEQVRESISMTDAVPDAGLATGELRMKEDDVAFRSIVEAQREVFALHEIAQTIGSSLNLQDTVTIIASKLRAILPFETCVIYVVDERSGMAKALHAFGDHAEAFAQRRVRIGEGITGWVIANGRSLCNTPPELDLTGLPEEIMRAVRCVLATPLVHEAGSFGAITLYSTKRSSYTAEHVRLLESVAQHASVALNNALTFERTRESALTDPVTELPNARSFRLILEQRLAESKRVGREPLTVLSMDLDGFRQVNDAHGHGVGDRLLARVAELIKKQLRQMDVLARFAGDEFVALMPMASRDVAASVAERIRAAVESHRFSVRTGRIIHVGMSVGVAAFPEDGETMEELLESAHRNMQRDKHARKLAPLSDTGSLASLDAFR